MMSRPRQNVSAKLASKSSLRLLTLMILVGITAGLGGMALGLLLHLTQHLAFGYGLNSRSAHESFLTGVSGAVPARRILALTFCGVIAGIGWWSVGRFGSPLVPIAKTVREDGPRMPPLTTMFHDLLQIVTVGLGSPLGREVAPRELGAVFAALLCDRARISEDSSRILIACGAGAGLAAVYNVPLGGALFTLEVLLNSWAPSAVIPALATSAIATAVASVGLGNARQYPVPPLASNVSFIVWSVAVGPLMGIAAHWFTRLTGTARSNAPKGLRLLPWCLGVFVGIGLLSLPFPQLLGNGRSLAHLSFDSDLTLGMACVLLLLRLLILAGALRAGAHGGLLTPGLSVGALLGVIGGILWNNWWPYMPVGAFAIVGAIAFLAASMKMPVTAIALGIEFTGVGHDFLVPIIAAVVGSISAAYLWRSRPITAVTRAELSERSIRFP